MIPPPTDPTLMFSPTSRWYAIEHSLPGGVALLRQYRRGRLAAVTTLFDWYFDHAPSPQGDGAGE